MSEFVQTSEIIRLTAVIVLLALWTKSVAVIGWVLLAYALILMFKHRHLLTHFRSPAAAVSLLLMPFVRVWMDVWMELGMIAQFFAGRDSTS